MFRAVLYLLIAIILISLIRSVVGIIGKTISAALEPSPGNSASRPTEQATGELKRDPVCGTYISAATSIKVSEGKTVLHFCSAACREKYEKSSA